MAEDMSKTGTSGETTLIRDISFCGVPENGSNASMVDVKDGKIVRIRPMHYDWKYKKADLNPWKFEVRGSTFEPSMKTLIPPYSIAYKKRVGSYGLWHVTVLDLATMRETPLAELDPIDDQIEWLDDETVLYHSGGGIQAVPADGSGAPREFLAVAGSPSVVRPAA